MAAESSATRIREWIGTEKLPRQVFEKLPREDHDATLDYLGYSDETAFFDFIAERKDGQIVRVDGLSVRDAMAARHGDGNGAGSDNCCSGGMDPVKMEFHMFYVRLPRVALVR